MGRLEAGHRPRLGDQHAYQPNGAPDAWAAAQSANRPMRVSLCHAHAFTPSTGRQPTDCSLSQLEWSLVALARLQTVATLRHLSERSHVSPGIRHGLEYCYPTTYRFACVVSHGIRLHTYAPSRTTWAFSRIDEDRARFCFRCRGCPTRRREPIEAPTASLAYIPIPIRLQGEGCLCRSAPRWLASRSAPARRY